MRTCNKCNISVPDNQVSCPQCGGHDFYELAEPSTEEYNRRRKKKMIIGLLICLGALILILTIAAVGVLFIDTHSVYYIGNKDTSTVQSEYILSDRQKSILQKEGLPTDYNSLSLTQKAGIEAIGDILEKYDGKSILIGTHGTALSTIINRYDASFGLVAYMRIINYMPYVVRMDFEGKEYIGMEELAFVAKKFHGQR